MAVHLPFPPLVARGESSLDNVCDPAAFAWEILRRRADYRPSGGAVAVKHVEKGKHPIELLTGVAPEPLWGLQFRGRPRPSCQRCPSLLAPGSRSSGNHCACGAYGARRRRGF